MAEVLADVDVERMQRAAADAVALLRALANRDRLLLLCRLSQGECRVGDLERELGIAQPTLSQQLTVLRVERLVSTRRDGRHIHYALRDARARALIETLYALFCAKGASRRAR
jgi:DNA-binding transcriptional ArsR family regulator